MNLKRFIEQNRFAMDERAVAQDLLLDYRLLKNRDDSGSQTWDFFVAVRYPTPRGYADIEAQWQAIRAAHTTVLSEALELPELGSIVSSDDVLLHSY